MSIQIEIPTRKPTIIMTRLYNASPEIIWQAMTQVNHVRQWWGGSGSLNTMYHMDLRPGGLWSQTTKFPDGGKLLYRFMFVEVTAAKRLVWQDVDHGTRKEGPPTCRTTVTLDEVGKQTRLTIVARFESMGERDTAVETGSMKPLEAGIEKLSAYLNLMPRKPAVAIVDITNAEPDDTV